MKKILKKIVKYTKVWVILLIIFNISLLITSLFPSDMIEENVKSSSDILLQEGNIYQIFEYSTIVNNNYTDAVIINEAYSIDNTNPIYSYMSMRKNYAKEETTIELEDIEGELASIYTDEDGNIIVKQGSFYSPVEELNEFVNGKINVSITYARYWHGYMVLYRILLLFFNIMGIRILLLILFMLMFIYLMYLLKKQFNIGIMLIFGYALIMQGYFFVSYSLESSPVFIVMMLACIILLKRIHKIKNLYMYFLIVGCITNFVDFFTVPLITLAIPLCIYILYKQKYDKDYKKTIKIILKSSIIWFIGYILTWISKWILFDILYQKDFIQSAIYQAMYRMERYNQSSALNLPNVIGEFITNNIQNILLFVIGMMIIRLCMLRKIRICVKQWKVQVKENLPFLVIAVMPFVWYIVLANHTVLHKIFVYRHMLIFLCSILICVMNLFVIKKKEKGEFNDSRSHNKQGSKKIE